MERLSVFTFTTEEWEHIQKSNDKFETVMGILMEHQQCESYVSELQTMLLNFAGNLVLMTARNEFKIPRSFSVV